MSADSRIVTMKFENAQFEAGARTTLSTLDKLKASMNFGNATSTAGKALGGLHGLLGKFSGLNPFKTSTQSLGALSGEAGRFNLNSMDGAITGISKSWLAMSTIALTAISNITTKVISSTTQWVKGFTIQPILDGLQEYKTNLQSIQTIQANTDQPFNKIKKSLDELNTYSDLTIYNFSQMAQNIGTFTAAGVDLKTATSSIKGIANLAALSGSSSQQAATAMYQLSQAISSGRVSLQDWNSVVNAGMGGKKLQNALAQTAVAMGDLKEGSVKLVGPMKQLKINGDSFRESIQAKPGEKPWLSSEILVNTLASLDGRFSDAALAAEKNARGQQKYDAATRKSMIASARLALEQKNGVKYTDEQFKALQKLSTSAFHAATEVKTLSQVFDVAKEAIGSGWAASFRNIFGTFPEAKKTFTDLSNYVNRIINDISLRRNNLLAGWSKRGGRDMAIEGIKEAWKGLLTILKPIGQAFRDIFPRKTVDDLLAMTAGFKSFAETIKISGSTADLLRRTFAGVFSIFSILGKVIGGVVTMFGHLFSAISGGDGGGLLNFTANLGDALVAFNNFLAKSDAIKNFFGTLGDILAVPIRLLGAFGAMLGKAFGAFDTGGAEKIGSAFDTVSGKVQAFQSVGDKIIAMFQRVGDFLGNIGSTIGNALMNIGDAIANSITPDTFSASLDVINTSLLGGLVFMLHKFLTGDLVKIDLGGGIFKQIRSTLGEATTALKDMQMKLKADILLKIAGALAILAASLYVLSTIDDKKLAKAMAAMAGGFGALVGTMAALMAVLGKVGVVQLYVISSAMTKLAASMLLLSFALKIMSDIPFIDMVRGLAGVAAMLFIMQKALIPMAKGSAGMGKASGSLILLGIALNIMAVALKIFASMSWEEMARGLAGVAGSLVIISGAMRLMPKNMVGQAAALVLIAGALNALATAMKIFATMKWEEMGRGMAALAGSMLILAGAMRLMPKDMLLTGAGLVVVATALNIIAGALKIMGGSSWEEIAKGLVTLGGAMLILSIGLNSMGPVALLGAAALVVAAGALTILTPVLVTLGAMSWEMIIKGLATLAATFVILGAAGLLLAPITPVLLGLGAAILLMGAGFALFGAGALALATAFGIIVATGTAGIQMIGQMLATVASSIPQMLAAFGRGIVAFAKAIANGGPAFVRAMSRIVSNMLDAVIKNVPKMGRAFLAMINTGIKVISSAVPKLINLGFKLIISFLRAIEKNVGKITGIAASIVIKFINAIGNKLPGVIQAGVRLIIKFINGVSKAIERNSKDLGAAGARLGVAIVKGMASGISGAGGVIRDAAMDAAHKAFDAVKNFFGVKSPSTLMRDEIGVHIPTGWAEGIDKTSDAPVRSLETLGRTALDVMKRQMAAISDEMALDGSLDPVVKPVLDLTALTKEANKMSDILATVPVIPSVSYGQAADIVTSTTKPADDEITPDGKPGDDGVTFIQNNYSPKALDPTTLYRQHKSLTALAKKELS